MPADTAALPAKRGESVCYYDVRPTGRTMQRAVSSTAGWLHQSEYARIPMAHALEVVEQTRRRRIRACTRCARYSVAERRQGARSARWGAGYVTVNVIDETGNPPANGYAETFWGELTPEARDHLEYWRNWPGAPWPERSR